MIKKKKIKDFKELKVDFTKYLLSLQINNCYTV